MNTEKSKSSTIYKFDTWGDAAQFCQKLGHPIVAIVNYEKRTIYPESRYALFDKSKNLDNALSMLYSFWVAGASAASPGYDDAVNLVMECYEKARGDLL